MCYVEPCLKMKTKTTIAKETNFQQCRFLPTAIHLGIELPGNSAYLAAFSLKQLLCVETIRLATVRCRQCWVLLRCFQLS